MQSRYQPEKENLKEVRFIPGTSRPPYLVEIMDTPLEFAEINTEALDVLYEEASIAASEIVSPNSFEWSSVQSLKYEELQHKFWIHFIRQYYDSCRNERP
jgi:hypothetical protein